MGIFYENAGGQQKTNTMSLLNSYKIEYFGFFPLFYEEKLQKSPLIFGSTSVAVTNTTSYINKLLCTDKSVFLQRATFEAPKAVEAIFSASVIFTKR